MLWNKGKYFFTFYLFLKIDGKISCFKQFQRIFGIEMLSNAKSVNLRKVKDTNDMKNC